MLIPTEQKMHWMEIILGNWVCNVLAWSDYASLQRQYTYLRKQLNTPYIESEDWNHQIRQTRRSHPRSRKGKSLLVLYPQSFINS